jgi:signal transduction histidine kinase
LGYEEGELARLLSSLLDGQAGSSRRAIFQSQQPGKKSGRSRRFIERTETPVLAANQPVIGWLMLFRDVTEEHELAERRADLTRMIVHDLRNPLTTLTSAIDLVEDRLKGSGKSRDIGELLENARRNCVDMLDMVDSLMDINRLEAGQLVVEAEAMRLPPLVERVVTRLRPLATQQNIALAFACPADLPAVWADEEMIRRVLVNLLDNALKFTPAGGRIEGRLAPEPPLSPGYEVGVRCTIRDSGPGIPLAFRQQIFDRFMHTNQGGAQVRGTGLGLAFCKLAVEAHHGRIWVEDEPGGGSRFVFTLPGIPVF